MLPSSQMPDVARHPNPPMGTNSCIEVRVDLSPQRMAGRTELLWVVPGREGEHVVACNPFFTYGIHCGDLVTVDLDSKLLLRVIRPCGLRTMRVAFTNLAKGRELYPDLCKQPMDPHLPHEWHTAGQVAIAVRDKRDQELAYNLFHSSVAPEQIEWEVNPEAF